jgi:hypothetical protein
MQSRSILNVVLFLVVLVLTLNIYIVKNSTTTSRNILTDTQPGKINRISIKHNKRVIALKKDKGGWRMIEPINISTNSFRVDSILKLLKTASHGQYVIDDLDLEKYGLDQPATSIKFDDIEISFGITNPVSNYRYVKTNEKIHLIDDFYYPLLSSQIGTLVARTLLPKDAKIKKLILPENILELDKDGIWTSRQSISTDAIVETIRSWKNDQAFGVHNYIDRKSLGDIEVHLSNQDEPIKFKITDDDPWLVIARPDLDIEYHFNTEFYNSLLKPGSNNKPEKKTHEQNQKETLVVPPEQFLNPPKQ